MRNLTFQTCIGFQFKNLIQFEGFCANTRTFYVFFISFLVREKTCVLNLDKSNSINVSKIANG